MATALPTKSNLECSICFEGFKTPKILSCGHSFCRECLESWIDGRKGIFPCPFCNNGITIPQGGVDKFITNFCLQTLVDSNSLEPKHYCQNHSKKKVEYYCQTCNLGLCSKCILKDHKDHEYLECDSSRLQTLVVEKLSKFEEIIKFKFEELEKTHATLLETSKKLKSFCDEACTKISEKTEKIISELKENCEKRQKEIRDNFDINESQLTETRQKVMTQIKNIKTDLDTSCLTTTEEPSLTLIQSLTKLQDLQKLCENMKTDIPPVTYLDWKEGNGDVCNSLGSNRIITVYPSIGGNVFKFNFKDIIKNWPRYYRCKDKCISHGIVWGCSVSDNGFGSINIFLSFQRDDNPRVWSCEIDFTLTLINRDKDKNITKGPIQNHNTVCEIEQLCHSLNDPSFGFIDSKNQFLVKFDILKVRDIKYMSKPKQRSNPPPYYKWS